MMKMSHLWNDENVSGCNEGNVSPWNDENVSPDGMMKMSHLTCVMKEMSHLWNDGNVSPVE